MMCSWVGVWALSAGQGGEGCLWGVFQQSQKRWVQGTEPEESRRWRQASGWRDPDCVSQLRAAVGLEEARGFLHTVPYPHPEPPPAETFAVLGVNSGVKQNITASTHSFDGYCNLRICACFFSGVALRSSVERWILCLSSRFSPRTRMLLAVLMAWKEQNPVLLSTRLERKSKGGCPFNKRPSQVYFVEQGTFPEGGPFVFNHYPS